MASFKFSLILLGLRLLLWWQSITYKEFKKHLSQKNFTAQIQIKDKTIGRWFTFKNGKILSSSGIKNKPEVTLTFKDSKVAVGLLMPLVMAFLLKINARLFIEIN